MANQRIEMRKVKRLFKLYTEGVSKRTISVQLGLSRNTVSKYIDFFSTYQLTAYEVEQMSVEELQALFLSGQKPKSERLRTLEQYFPYFDRELKKTGVTAPRWLSICCGKNTSPVIQMALCSRSSSTGTGGGVSNSPQ